MTDEQNKDLLGTEEVPNDEGTVMPEIPAGPGDAYSEPTDIMVDEEEEADGSEDSEELGEDVE
jgi:hypothetical protein